MRRGISASAGTCCGGQGKIHPHPHYSPHYSRRRVAQHPAAAAATTHLHGRHGVWVSGGRGGGGRRRARAAVLRAGRAPRVLRDPDRAPYADGPHRRHRLQPRVRAAPPQLPRVLRGGPGESRRAHHRGDAAGVGDRGGRAASGGHPVRAPPAGDVPPPRHGAREGAASGGRPQAGAARRA